MAEETHRHWFALHRHPDWHGHCTRTITRCPKCGGSDLLESPISDRRDKLWCWDCDHKSIDYTQTHSCRRWHFHGPFRHLHAKPSR